MALPAPFKVQVDKKQSVFLYCKTLADSANALAFILKQKEYFSIWSGPDIKKAEANKAPVVWVVGHGEDKNENVVNSIGGKVIHIKDIVDWCVALGVQDLVDTCCFPFARRDAVKKLAPKLNYYCKSENKVMGRIGNYQKTVTPGLSDLELWWDGEKVAAAHP